MLCTCVHIASADGLQIKCDGLFLQLAGCISIHVHGEGAVAHDERLVRNMVFAIIVAAFEAMISEPPINIYLKHTLDLACRRNLNTGRFSRHKTSCTYMHIYTCRRRYHQ